MMKKFLAITLLLASALLTQADTDLRHWIFNNGKTVNAAMKSWDSETNIVNLRVGNAGALSTPRSELSLIDQAWVRRWHMLHSELEAKLKVAGGTVKTYQSDGEYATDFYVYYPSAYKEGVKLPMILLFHHAGKGHECLKRHFEAAESVSMILVCVDIFRNTDDNDKLEGDMRKRFEHLLPMLETTIPHDPKKFFMGGSSGGAWRAFHYSAWFDRPWAGIYSNVGWLGYPEKYYGLPYPANMRVAMTNGYKDHARRRIKPDTEVLNARGSEVAAFAFEGGHEIAPTASQIEAFRWMLQLPDEDE